MTFVFSQLAGTYKSYNYSQFITDDHHGNIFPIPSTKNANLSKLEPKILSSFPSLIIASQLTTETTWHAISQQSAVIRGEGGSVCIRCTLHTEPDEWASRVGVQSVDVPDDRPPRQSHSHQLTAAAAAGAGWILHQRCAVHHSAVVLWTTQLIYRHWH